MASRFVRCLLWRSLGWRTLYALVKRGHYPRQLSALRIDDRRPPTFRRKMGTVGPLVGSSTMTFSLPKEVLVVEDEPFVRMVAADALTDRGIMAWEAGDAGE